MLSAAIAFSIALFVCTTLTPVLRALAHRWNLLDEALSSRKVHGRPIPRLGGIAIVIAFYVPIVGLLVTDSSVGRIFFADGRQALGLVIGGLLIATLGVYDDLRGADAKVKFTVQFGVAALMYALGVRIDEVSLPFWEHLQLGWFGIPVTLLWIAGVINAMNLIDGLDGLAGGVALIAVAALFAIAFEGGQPLMLLFTAALGGAILGFLFFNFNPASIFMGDTGSMFLGFVLATASIQVHHKSSTAIALAIPVVALGIPILDTVLAMARRVARGAPLFAADRGHIHHRLLALSLSQREAVLLIYAAATVLGAAALALAAASASQALILLTGLALAILLVLRRLGYLRPENVRRLLEERQRNRKLHGGVAHAAVRLRLAAGAGDIWNTIQAAALGLGARGVALKLVRDHDALHFGCGFEDLEPGHFRTSHNLRGERREGGHIELSWVDGQKTIDRDTEIAVEVLCKHVRSAAERIDLDREVPTAANEPGTEKMRTRPHRAVVGKR